MARPKLKIFTTPIVKLVFPHLVTPDFGTEKFPKPAGQYSTKASFSPDQIEELRPLIQPLHDAAVAKGKAMFDAQPARQRAGKEFKANPWYLPEYDEGDSETGNFLMTFKMTASGISKKTKERWEAKPDLFDSMGRPLGRKPLRIFSGTEARIAFQVPPLHEGDDTTPGYWTMIAGAGLSFRLSAVQIVKLATSARNASSFGFGAVEGGFSANEVSEEVEEDVSEEGGATAEAPAINDDW